ncbi:MAG: hemoglobin-like flavoprotein [Limisphaerales bacterium]|jgi:hemoglobin-like flavoprotein
MSLANPHFEASFDRVFNSQGGVDSNDAFFEVFYTEFTKDPEVLRMFKDTNKSRQLHMLKRSVYDLVNLSVTDIHSSELSRLILLHTKLDTTPAQLDKWLEALLRTVKQFDPDFDDLVRLAWVCAMTPGITLFRAGFSDTTG